MLNPAAGLRRLRARLGGRGVANGRLTRGLLGSVLVLALAAGLGRPLSESATAAPPVQVASTGTPTPRPLATATAPAGPARTATPTATSSSPVSTTATPTPAAAALTPTAATATASPSVPPTVGPVDGARVSESVTSVGELAASDGERAQFSVQLFTRDGAQDGTVVLIRGDESFSGAVTELRTDGTATVLAGYGVLEAGGAAQAVTFTARLTPGGRGALLLTIQAPGRQHRFEGTVTAGDIAVP